MSLLYNINKTTTAEPSLRMNRNTGGLLGSGPGEMIQTRDLLYRLIISQLFYDGYQQVAVTLSNIVHSDPPCPPSDRLSHVVTLGLDRETEPGHRQRLAQLKSRDSALFSLIYAIKTQLTSLGPLCLSLWHK